MNTNKNSNTKKEKAVLIVGAGGHGKVIADILEKLNRPPSAFIDDNPALWGLSFFGYRVWGGMEYLFQSVSPGDYELIIGIGDNLVRKKNRDLCEAKGFAFGTAVHPSAQLGKNAAIGEGTVVMANCAVNPDTVIGKHVIINTGVTIDHDGVIGDFVHISPGAHLGGTVHVGESTWIGLGASVINNINIGEFATIGAGTVVIRDVDPFCVMVGNPAAFLKKNIR